MSAVTLPSLASYAAPFGGCYVTICVAFILYGMTSIQTYACLRNFPGDSKRVKATVIVVWLLETVHTAFCVEFTYQYLIIGYGNPLILAKIHWSAGVLTTTTLVIVIIVHSFFIYRVWVLSNKCLPAVAIPTILVLINTGFDAAVTAFLFKYKTWEAFHAQTETLVAVYVASSLLVAIDIMVTVILVYYLHGRRTRYERTSHLVRQLEMYVVNSGAITIAASMSVLLTFALLNDNLLYAGLEQILCKLYTNALLATLNARKIKGGTFVSSDPSEANSHELSLQSDMARRAKISARPTSIHISQQVTSDTAGDASIQIGVPSAEKIHALKGYPESF